MEITKITDDNIAFFKPVIPDSLLMRSTLRLGAVHNGTACGVLLADVGEKDAELLWFFVDEKHRNMGCGELLMSAFTSMTDELSIPLGFFTLNEAESTSTFVSFLEAKTGFVREFDDVGRLLSFRLSSVDTNILKGADKTDIRPLSSILSREEHMIRDILNQTFGVTVTDEEFSSWKSSGLSFVRVRDNKVCSFILVRLADSSRYELVNVDYIYDSNNDIKSLLGLISTVQQQTGELDLPPNTKVQTVSLSNVITALLDKLTGGEMTDKGNLTVWTRRKR